MKDKEKAAVTELDVDGAIKEEELATASPRENQDIPLRSSVHGEISHETYRSGQFDSRSESAMAHLGLGWKQSLLSKLAEVNKELWLLLSIMIIAGAINYLVTSQRIVLGFYALPTLFSAYFYGRRHAVLTACASVLIVVFLAHFNAGLFAGSTSADLANGPWYELGAWGGILIVTAFAMGTLYEKQKLRLKELHQTYRGLLLILRQFVAKDKFTENHCYRVSVYASEIATTMGLPTEQIEDTRAASLIHDIGKLDTSRKLLYKAARLTVEEFNEIKKHADRGASMLEPIGGPLHRIIPIILAHHDKYDGSGYHPLHHDRIPLEARIIAVADAYDSLTSDRPYRKAVTPFEAKDIIVNSSGTDFDPNVVAAFLTAFSKGDLEVPEFIL